MSSTLSWDINVGPRYKPSYTKGLTRQEIICCQLSLSLHFEVCFSIFGYIKWEIFAKSSKNE